MNQLNLLDSFVLLSIDDDKGNYVIGSIHLNYGLIAAGLIELAIQGKIDMEGETITVDPSKSINDPVLAIIAHQLNIAEKPLSLKKWLQKLQSQAKAVLSATINRLVEANILEVQKGKILWIIPTTKYPTENPIAERRLKQRLREIVLDGRAPDAQEMMLLSLVQTCGLIPEIFSKDQRKFAEQKIKALSESNQIVKELGETIQMIQTVIMITTNAAVMSAITTTVITN